MLVAGEVEEKVGCGDGPTFGSSTDTFESPGGNGLDVLGRRLLVAGEVKAEVVCLLPKSPAMSFSRRPPSASTPTEEGKDLKSSAEGCSLPVRLRRRQTARYLAFNVLDAGKSSVSECVLFSLLPTLHLRIGGICVAHQ